MMKQLMAERMPIKRQTPMMKKADVEKEAKEKTDANDEKQRGIDAAHHWQAVMMRHACMSGKEADKRRKVAFQIKARICVSIGLDFDPADWPPAVRHY